MNGALKELAGYSKAVTEGKIIACKKHKWACLRFLEDVKRRGAWEWDFDGERAERYFNWMRLFKHSRGELAGQPKIPCDYELFVYGNIYGWVSADGDGRRRFRRMYEQLARKQAKSQDKAIQALYEISAFGEPNAEAYVAATKKEQTRYVWEEADWLFRNSSLKDRFVCKYDKAKLQPVIKHVKSGSTFSRLSKDDRKSGDGANPHFGVIDESHLHEDDSYYGLFLRGMKTRKNPLLSIITTAGADLNKPCYTVEYKYASDILNPDVPINDDRYFVMICELDRNDTPDVMALPDGRAVEPGGYIDELGTDAAIMKSNPVTGRSAVVRENIVLETQEARNKPEMMRDLLTKTYNVWVQRKDMGYMDMARWSLARVSPEELLSIIAEKVLGRCFVGFDLSATIDLTSVSFIFPWYDGNTAYYAVHSHSFIPEDKFLENKGNDNVPYDVWEKQGYLTITGGATVNHTAVTDYVLNLCGERGWNIDECCLDQWSATSVSNYLQEQGCKTVVYIQQTIKALSAATAAFREAVYDKRVLHDGNPVLAWAMGNAVTQMDSNNNIKLCKSKSKQRIDPAAATITAFVRASIPPPPKPKRRMIRFM
jgi:phage terminase large subunit-like protein